MKFKQFAKIMAVNTLLIGVGVLLFEAGLQVVAFLRPSYSVLFLKPDPDLGWKMVPNYKWKWSGKHWYANAFSLDVQSNSVGFRGNEIIEQKAMGTSRMAILGDSFVEAIQVPLEQTSVKVTEQIMNDSDEEQKWEVLNFGISGFGVGQYLLVWDKYVKKYSPDYVAFIVGDLQMNRTVSAYKVGSFSGTEGELLSIRPIFSLGETGELAFQPAKDYQRSLKLQDDLISDHFEGGRLKRQSNGLIVPKYFNALMLRLNTKLSGEKARSDFHSSSSSNFKDVREVNYLLIRELARRVSSSGAELIMLDASRHQGDQPSTSDFLRKISSELGIHYLPIYVNLLKSDRAGRPTTFHTDGHYNELGNKIVAEDISAKVKQIMLRN